MIKKMIKIKNFRLYKKFLDINFFWYKIGIEYYYIFFNKNGLFFLLNGLGFFLNLNVDKFIKVCIEKFGIYLFDVVSELEGIDFVFKFLFDITS